MSFIWELDKRPLENIITGGDDGVSAPAAITASTSQSEQQQNDAEKESRLKICPVVDAYDAVIRANRALDRKYQAEEEILLKRLKEIQAELKESKGKRQIKTEPDKQDVFRYNSVGKPYFKDKYFNHPPDNEDTLIMKRYQMYDFSNVMTVSGWTVGDKTRLLAVLLDLSKDIIKKKILSEITKLQRAKEKTKATTYTSKIAKLKHELLTLKHKTLEDLDLPIDQEFDWEDIALKLNKRHSSREYKAIWDLFFHPRVNKSAWGHKEHQDLLRIASEKNMQDWESIAKALNTGRTGYQCFVYFRTNVNHAASGRKWTQEEMSYLQRVIDLYKEENYIPWGKVAACMQNRTKIQCYNKYLRMIGGRKGRFLPEEDAVILNFVQVYGTDFRKMSSFLTGRSAMQLRVRYNLLQKIRVSTTWSVDDDRKLLQIMANQDSRTNFSTATKHFPGKDRQNIRSRYNTLLRWMKTHPQNDISTAPRRAARRLSHGEPTSNLVKAIDNLRSRMKAELEKSQDERKANKIKKQVTRDSSENVIHDSIMSTIATIDSQLQFATLNKTQKARVEGKFQMLKLKEISSRPREQANLFNIKHFLILLNAKLANKSQFYSSTIGEGFQEIENKKPVDASQINIKSYSKTTVVNIEPDIRPTLFGTIAGSKKFLIPPNFATITGSRVILTLLSNAFAKEKSDINITSLARRNVVFDMHLTRLRERFIDLFTWPYILSNEPPEYYRDKVTDNMENRAKSKPVHKPLPDTPAVTIPLPPKHLRVKDGEDQSIDVEMQVEDTNTIVMETSFDCGTDMFEDRSSE